MRFIKSEKSWKRDHSKVGELEMFVQSFLDSGYDYAEVLAEDSYKSVGTQAGSLHNECRKHFKTLVAVHLSGGRIFLERLKGGQDG